MLSEIWQKIVLTEGSYHIDHRRLSYKIVRVIRHLPRVGIAEEGFQIARCLPPYLLIGKIIIIELVIHLRLILQKGSKADVLGHKQFPLRSTPAQGLDHALPQSVMNRIDVRLKILDGDQVKDNCSS